MLLEKSVLEFLDEVDSSSPAPGGGSVSALAGALGVCLSRMYAHLSVGKKKFLELDEQIQTEFVTHFEALAEKKTALCKAVDRDCEAYDRVMAAYKMPKITEEEIKTRNQAIHDATITAIESPYSIMELSLEALRLCKEMVEYGNKNAISDLACGVIFLDAAVQGAGLNVLINLSSLDETESSYWNEKMNAALEESAGIKESVVKRIKELL